MHASDKIGRLYNLTGVPMERIELNISMVTHLSCCVYLKLYHNENQWCKRVKWNLVSVAYPNSSFPEISETFQICKKLSEIL